MAWSQYFNLLFLSLKTQAYYTRMNVNGELKVMSMHQSMTHLGFSIH